jgi:hypothetical protein
LPDFHSFLILQQTQFVRLLFYNEQLPAVALVLHLCDIDQQLDALLICALQLLFKQALCLFGTRSCLFVCLVCFVTDYMNAFVMFLYCKKNFADALGEFIFC